MSQLVITHTGSVYTIHNDETVTREGWPELNYTGPLTLKDEPVRGERFHLVDADGYYVLTSTVQTIIQLPGWV